MPQNTEARHGDIYPSLHTHIVRRSTLVRHERPLQPGHESKRPAGREADRMFRPHVLQGTDRQRTENACACAGHQQPDFRTYHRLPSEGLQANHYPVAILSVDCRRNFPQDYRARPADGTVHPRMPEPQRGTALPETGGNQPVQRHPCPHSRRQLRWR